MLFRFSGWVGLVSILASASVWAQTPTPTAVPVVPAPATIPSISSDVIARIRDEGMNRSKVMSTLQTLCDTYGQRLTGSPSVLDANEWTRNQMIGYGMSAHLEPWGPFGRSWELEKFTGQVSSPLVFPVIAYPKAWSPSTKGELNAQVVIFNPQTDADYASAKGKLKGKIVLVSPIRALKLELEPRAKRRSDEDLQRLANAPVGVSAASLSPTPTPVSPSPAPVTAAPDPQAPPPNSQPASPAATPTPTPLPGVLTPLMARQARRLNFLKAEGAALLLDNSTNGAGGTVFVAQASVPQDIPLAKPTWSGRIRLAAQDEEAKKRLLPQMTLATEDYNRLYRMVASGQKVKMRAQITAKLKPNAPTYNTIGEIQGSDLKNQVVMMGGHMDSWQGASGATDNGAGVAVALEAARILKALGLQPRRTIRVALWTGEEEGLLGSAAYVGQHFGRINTVGTTKTFVPGPEYDNLSAYYNLDNGAGRTRGIYAQSNTSAVPYFAAWMAPFADLNSSTVTLANTGSTDHISFDRIGLPGFQFIQDGLEYSSETHHSNEDTLDRVPEEDLKQAAVMMATTVYQTSMMNERFPRKPLDLR